MLLLIAFWGCGKKPELPAIAPETPKISEISEKSEKSEISEISEISERPKTLQVEAISMVGTISVAIAEDSKEVTTVYVSCGDYRQEKEVLENKVVFTAVPEEGQCTLKFAPLEIGFTAVKAGADLICTITDGLEINCE